MANESLYRRQKLIGMLYRNELARGLGEPAQNPRLAERAVQRPERAAVEWAAAHLSEREAVFTRTDLLTAALAWRP